MGIKCPEKHGLENTSYCFVETTGPSIITDDENIYLEGVKLTSYTEITGASGGDSFGSYMYEYQDARKYMKIRGRIEDTGKINLFRNVQLKRLKEKYGIE